MTATVTDSAKVDRLGAVKAVREKCNALSPEDRFEWLEQAVEKYTVQSAYRYGLESGKQVVAGVLEIESNPARGLLSVITGKNAAGRKEKMQAIMETAWRMHDAFSLCDLILHGADAGKIESLDIVLFHLDTALSAEQTPDGEREYARVNRLTRNAWSKANADATSEFEKRVSAAAKKAEKQGKIDGITKAAEAEIEKAKIDGKTETGRFIKAMRACIAAAQSQADSDE